MRVAKKNPAVICIPVGKEKITDNSKEFTEADFPNKEFDELIRRGFLVLVTKKPTIKV